MKVVRGDSRIDTDVLDTPSRLADALEQLAAGALNSGRRLALELIARESERLCAEGTRQPSGLPYDRCVPSRMVSWLHGTTLPGADEENAFLTFVHLCNVPGEHLDHWSRALAAARTDEVSRVRRVDPTGIDTFTEFKKALALVYDIADSATERIAKKSKQLVDAGATHQLSGRPMQVCPSATTHDWVRGSTLPSKSSHDVFLTFLHLCSVPDADLDLWLQALGRARTNRRPRPTDQPPGVMKGPAPPVPDVLAVLPSPGAATEPAASIIRGPEPFVPRRPALPERLRRRNAVIDAEGAFRAWSAGLQQRWRGEVAAQRWVNPALVVRWETEPLTERLWTALCRAAHERGTGWHPRAQAPVPQSPVRRGRDDELVTLLLDHLPNRQLMLVGESGTGKTVLLMQIAERMAERATENSCPYPLLVALSSWNPTQPFGEWLVERLIAEDPDGLARTAADGSEQVAQMLVRTGRVFPLLDGLDEVGGAPQQAAALAKIDEWLQEAPRTGLAVASRPVAEGSPRLSATPMVMVAPLMRDDAERYLADQTHDPGWTGLLAEHDNLAEAMTRPLTVGLAVSVYRPGAAEDLDDPDGHHVSLRAGTVPAGLASVTGRDGTVTARTPSGIVAHLLVLFLPRVYMRHPQRWSSAQAARWLHGMARMLQGDAVPRRAGQWLRSLARAVGREDAQGTNPQPTQDRLLWWELRARTPYGLVPAVLGVFPGLVIGIVAGLDPRLGSGLGWGILAGIATGLGLGAVQRRRGRGRPTGRRDVGPGIAWGFVGGAAGAVITGGIEVALGLSDTAIRGVVGALGAGIAAGAVNGPRRGVVGGLVGGAVVTLTASTGVGWVAGVVDGIAGWLASGLVIGTAGLRLPARRLQDLDRVVAYTTGVTVGLVIGALAVIRHGPVLGITAGVAIGITGGIAAGRSAPAVVPNGLSADPHAVLRADRRTFLAMAALGGLSFGSGAAVTGTVWVGLAALVTVGLVSGATRTSWPAFVVARCWFALRRTLPLRLMSFLRDAHERGVLRRSGAAYAIRHQELLWHFAREPAPPTTAGGSARDDGEDRPGQRPTEG